MVKVIKTTFEEEQKQKEKAWLKLSPYERLTIAFRISEMTRKPEINYSYEGMKVTIVRHA